MSNNSNLHKAKKAKNDEFYTQLSDIENELIHYQEHFNDKIVYCNCDDPTQSNFVKYFQINFDKLNLKKLIVTGYKKNCRGLKLIYDSNCKDANVEELEGNGDFRSEECVKLLDEADIVVTNPMFSLFREYVAQLVKYDKKFLIISNINSITYKEIFPLIKANKIWIGYNFNKTMEFQLDERYEKWNEIRDGKKYGKVPAIAWFTNLDVKKRHEKLVLTEKYDPAKYPKYDNYDAINVDKVNDIPKDYYGVIGVPITFFGKYNPDQFEIVQFRKGEDGRDLVFTREREREFNNINGFSSKEIRPYEEPVDKAYPLKFQFTKDKCKVNGKETYSRIFIRRKPAGENAETPAA